jgi:integrase
VHAVLVAAFQVAVDERPALLEVNPAREIRFPKQDRREMFFLQDARAYSDLRAAIEAHFRPLLDFLVGTGARFGEAAGLLVRHLHLDAERPYVDIRLVLKWARKRWMLGRPKTKSSVRRITLSPKLVEFLRPLVEGKHDDAHVFTMVAVGPLHHGNFSSRYFKPAVKAAGTRVPGRLRIHDLRHTHAAWLLSDGVPTWVVQRRLGHSTSATTENIYGHLTVEANDRTLALVDRRLPEILVRDKQGARLIQLTAQERRLPEFDVDDDDDLAA